MKSKSLLLLLGLLVAVVAGYLLAGRVLGHVAVRAVNAYGPDITGTTVTLGRASLSPVTGRGWMEDLVVGNPAGYAGTKAFSLGHLEIALQPVSLLRDTVMIDEILIRQPEFNLESKLTTSNLQEIVDHAKSGPSSGESEKAPAGGTAPSAPARAKKLIVHQFVLVDATVKLSVAGVELATTIPRLELNEIGAAKGGVTPAEAVSEVLPQILQAVIEAGAKTTGTQDLKVRAKELGRQLKDAAREIFRK